MQNWPFTHYHAKKIWHFKILKKIVVRLSHLKIPLFFVHNLLQTLGHKINFSRFSYRDTDDIFWIHVILCLNWTTQINKIIMDPFQRSLQGRNKWGCMCTPSFFGRQSQKVHQNLLLTKPLCKRAPPDLALATALHLVQVVHGFEFSAKSICANNSKTIDWRVRMHF